MLGEPVAERRQRSLDLRKLYRQREDIMRAGPDELANEREVLVGADGDRARLDALEQPCQRDQGLETRVQGFGARGAHRSSFRPASARP